MKIGIITFHCAHNYGAVLQCYALQTFLEQENQDVRIIDYRPSFLIDCYKWFQPYRFRSRKLFTLLHKCHKELVLLRYRRKRYNAFNEFISSRLKLTQEESISNEAFDLIIIGSDQVWNINLTQGFDPKYWGDFSKPSQTRIISYAASMEEDWNEKEKKTIQHHLANFTGISVRESTLAAKLSQIYTEKEINTVVDPTLLISKKVWEELAVPPKSQEPYLLLYQVRNSSQTLEFAQAVAAQKKLKLVCLSARIDSPNSKECISASPNEFLGYFKYATFVICSSFHGTVFSLIFNKNFYSIRMNDGKDSRVNSLLESLDMLSRFVDTDHDTRKDNSIDWELINKKIESISHSSKSFLRAYTS